MNQFKKGLEFKSAETAKNVKSIEDTKSVEREKSGKIIITEPLKNLLIELMKGNISKKEVMEKAGIGDKATIERKLEEVALSDTKLQPLYEEYVSHKSEDFEGYNFRAEAIEMLRKDYSQSVMANKIGVNRRSFSTKIKKLAEENKENILGELLANHADRKMKRQQISLKERLEINLLLDQYEEEFPIGVSRYESRKPQEVRIENMQRVIDLVGELVESGKTIKEISKEGIINESTYRKYKSELANLKSLTNGRGKEEE